METYLVEHYRPGSGPAELQGAAERVRAAASALAIEGGKLRYLRSTIVPGDEAFLSIFEADSESAIRDAYARAGVAFERISRALAAES
jgi:muconolactone delta-isomerase